MALFGNVYNLETMFNKSESLQILYRYLLEALDSSSIIYNRIVSLDCKGDRIENKIDLGFGMVAIEQSYKLNGGRFESHKQFIDFQLMIRGAEYMEFGDISDFEIDTKYDANKDLILYHHRSEVSKMLLQSGKIAVFFPYDVHCGGIIANCDIVYKSVVKVPSKLLKFCF